ncbi:hypothetical protein SAMN05216362_12943, partial [Piscibacillus halophilus]
ISEALTNGLDVGLDKLFGSDGKRLKQDIKVLFSLKYQNKKLGNGLIQGRDIGA